MSIHQTLEKRRQAAVSEGIGVMCSFYADKAKNAEIWDLEGHRYIDFAGGIGVLNVGHLHPKVKQAVQAQLENFSHTCYQVVPYEGYISLAEKINQKAPISGTKKAAFLTTGAEAVENAIKVARKATGRSGIIAFNGAFHGRTNLTMALTGKVAPYKIGFGPFASEVYHTIYPNPMRGVSVDDALHHLTDLFKYSVEAATIAAIIIEPVQGEGGFNVTPDHFMIALRKICDEHGILLIFDEVQSGFCRTGKTFAAEHYSVEPDIITFAKSIAGGLPLSGVVGRAKLMDAAGRGGLGGTYAGNPLAIAAANAVMEIIDEEKINERSERLGKKLVAKLQELQKKVPQMRDVRGLGSMIAIEFSELNGEFAKKVQEHALQNGLILLTCGAYYNVIRFLYPITIEDEVFDEALNKVEQALLYASAN